MPTTPVRTNRDEFEPVLASLPPAGDEFDALADLFLGDDEPRGVPSEPVSRAAAATPSMKPRMAAVELLVQGHLPVRAAPWASQYARLRASALHAPVALIRLVGGNLSVEMFGMDSPDLDETTDANGAVSAAARCAALCIVQLDEVHQAAVAGDPRVAAVTVLGGANEAAVVATYRTLKGLAGVLAPAAEGNEPPTELQVAFVTTEEGASRDALERLRRAAAVFLDRPLALAGTVGKIAPTGAVPLFRGECEMGPGRMLDALMNPERHSSASERDADPRADSTRISAPKASAPAAAPPSGASLARFVAGLRELSVRCPDDSSVELAVDAGGRLHLLRQDPDSRGVERLVSVSAWAVKHAALLASAGCGVDFRHAPVMHLFTESPKSVRHLLDADVRVHILARAASEWYCAELN